MSDDETEGVIEYSKSLHGNVAREAHARGCEPDQKPFLVVPRSSKHDDADVSCCDEPQR